MTKRKKNPSIQDEITIPLTAQDLPLEELKQLIDSNLITDELPFELLATHYPSLLSEWYPGYPDAPRPMTKKDPMRCRGYIKNGTVTFRDIPGLKDSPIPLGENIALEGEHDVWLTRDDNDAWFVHVIVDD